MKPELNIREATPEDSECILEFIRALARYEKLEHDCTATAGQIREMLFGPRPFAQCLIASWEGKAAGFAVYFYKFSTFRAAPVLYLEDLFVHPELRGKGIGKALFETLREKARRENCARYEWSVLDWNTPSIQFYEAAGAQAMREWVPFRIEFVK